MKSRFFIVAAALLSIAACKTPYKATDTPMPSKDGNASPTDTTAVNKDPESTNSSGVSKTDSISKPLTGIPKTDSVMMKPAPDSAMKKMGIDSTHMPSASDSAKTSSNAITTQAPAAVEAVFVKQYPNAANAVWSQYDSLAAVPIDMRLTGWKRMDTLDHMVKFDLNGEPYYAWYDSNGKWIGSASPMTDLTKLPAAVTTAVNNAIKTRYDGYTVSQVNREFQTGKKSYEVELTKDDNKIRMLVNSAGKITEIYRYKAEKK